MDKDPSPSGTNLSDSKDQLIVLLHAYGMKPKDLDRLKAETEQLLPSGHVVVPEMPVCTFSVHDPDEIAEKLLSTINSYVSDRENVGGTSYNRIILVGHSLGAVMARKVWAMAHGADASGNIDPELEKPWAHKIDRLVLLAAMGRGWIISSAQPPLKRLIWYCGTIIHIIWHYILRQRGFMIFGLRRGAPFLTETRLQCLSVEASLMEANRAPVIVQLLGTADEYVAPSDNIDFATGQNFVYLEAKGASHKGIIKLDRPDILEKFKKSLSLNIEQLREIALRDADVFDFSSESVDRLGLDLTSRKTPKASLVVFIIHGIRDPAFWTKRIASRIKKIGRENGTTVSTITSTYGYFPMGPFLFPWSRRNKVEWLLDQYVTAKALYPEAELSFIGHSNGTYLLAKALELCPAVRFENVVFAGSVVSSQFNWEKYLRNREMDISTGSNTKTTQIVPAQLGKLVNYVATGDWVVACFPFSFEKVPIQDLGGAGHIGFSRTATSDQVVNVKYVKGAHSAALGESTWDEIANFVIMGDFPATVRGEQRSRLVDLLGRFGPFLAALLCIIITSIGILILWPLRPAAFLAVVFTVYVSFLYLVATKA